MMFIKIILILLKLILKKMKTHIIFVTLIIMFYLLLIHINVNTGSSYNINNLKKQSTFTSNKELNAYNYK